MHLDDKRSAYTELLMTLAHELISYTQLLKPQDKNQN